MEQTNNQDLVDLTLHSKKKLLRLSERECLDVMAGLMLRPGEDFLQWFSSYAQRTLNFDFAFVGELVGADWDQIQTLKVCNEGKILDNFNYDLLGTPCSDVLNRNVCVCFVDVAKKFPQDPLLVEMGLEGYIGISLLSETKVPLGIAVLLHQGEVTEKMAETASVLLQLFRPRLEAELTYRHAMRALKFSTSDAVTSQSSLEHLVATLSKETRMRVAWVSEISNEDGDVSAQTLAFVKDGALQANFTYSVEETPCVRALGGNPVTILDQVRSQYPEVQRLRDLSAEALISFPLKNDKDDVIGLVVLVHDRPIQTELTGDPIFQLLISRIQSELRRLRAENNKKALEHRLLEGQRRESIGALAGGIAHDFNNLLFVMSGQALVMQLETDEEDEKHEQLQTIIDATEQGADLCKQLLTYAGRQPSSTEILDLNDVLRASKRVTKMLATRKVEIEYNLNSSALKVQGSQTQLQQVVMNLVKNAADAIDDSGHIYIETLEQQRSGKSFAGAIVAASNLADGKYATLKITDNGSGMGADHLRKIFDPFFSTKGSGHGMGLSVVLGSIVSHGGAVEVQSTAQKGTTFVISLPLLAVPGDVPGEKEQDAPEKDLLRESSAVLVIDDDNLVRKTLRSMLNSNQNTSILASNGKEGIDIFREKHLQIAAVILDYSMPGMCGDEVLVALRKISRDVPVVMMSGNIGPEMVQQFPEKPDAFFGKPYALRSLLEKLNGLVEAAGLPSPT